MSPLWSAGTSALLPELWSGQLPLAGLQLLVKRICSRPEISGSTRYFLSSRCHEPPGLASPQRGESADRLPPAGGQVDALPGGAAPGDAVRVIRRPSAADLPEPLTERERAVLRFLATSLSPADIAAELSLSVNTVKSHIAAIYRKLAASKRKEAVLRGRGLELI